MIGALAILAAAATPACEPNCTSDFLNRLVTAAEASEDVSPDVLSPVLSESQIVQFRAIKGCRFAASYASSDDHVIWTWYCRAGTRGNYLMEVAAHEGRVIGVSFDGRMVWPVLEEIDG